MPAPGGENQDCPRRPRPDRCASASTDDAFRRARRGQREREVVRRVDVRVVVQLAEGPETQARRTRERRRDQREADGTSASISRLMSAAGAECVSEPMETQLAPSDASAGMRSSVTPPEISIRARPSIVSTACAHLIVGEVVEHDGVGAGGERLVHLAEALRLDLDRHVDAAAADAPHGLGDRAGDADVVVLDQDAVEERRRGDWCRRRIGRRTWRARAAPARSSACRGSRTGRRTRPRTARVSVAIPERCCRKLSAVRSAVRSDAAGPMTSASSHPTRRGRRPASTRPSRSPRPPGRTPRARCRARRRRRPAARRARRAPGPCRARWRRVVMSPGPTSSSSARPTSSRYAEGGRGSNIGRHRLNRRVKHARRQEPHGGVHDVIAGEDVPLDRGPRRAIGLPGQGQVRERARARRIPGRGRIAWNGGAP